MGSRSDNLSSNNSVTVMQSRKEVELVQIAIKNSYHPSGHDSYFTIRLVKETVKL